MVCRVTIDHGGTADELFDKETSAHRGILAHNA
jgi:hypothetical protein